MRPVTCNCGFEFVGETAEAIGRSAREHMAAVHPQLALTDGNIEDYVAAALRMTGSTERLEQIGAVEIHEVTPERVADFLSFFDYDGFADNPAWAGCYCMFFYRTGPMEGWEAARAAENRAQISDLLSCGRARGYLAYVDGQPAAWVNAAPKALLPQLREGWMREGEDPAAVGSIACFVIAPPYRRHGLARQLLERAVADFRSLGLHHVEAYPSKDTPTDAAAYHGPMSMYRAAGFLEEQEKDGQVLVRLAL